MKKFIPSIVRLGIAITLIVSLIVFINLKNNPEICEMMSRGFARGYTSFMSKLTSFIPFSLTEVSFILLGAGIIALLVFAIISLAKKKYLASLNRVIEIGAILLLSFNLYQVSCEFNYNRAEIPLPYSEHDVLREEHVDIYNYFADDLNYCISTLEFQESGEVKTDMSLDEIAKEVKKAYETSHLLENDYFSSSLGGVKPMLSSFIYREFQITGVTYSPLAEANINILNTKTNLPLTVAHELAHTIGVMREDDANKVAFYVCLNSEHPYLRFSAYSAYFDQIEAMVSSYYLLDEERENVHPVDKIFYTCRSYEYKYWKEHDLLGDIGEFINNLYIKSSGVKEGTASYSGGTEYHHDPTTTKLIPSLYHKLFFEKYYRQ